MMSGAYKQPVQQQTVDDPNTISEPMKTQQAPVRKGGPTPEQVKAAQDILNAYNNSNSEPERPPVDEKYQTAFDNYFNSSTPHADRPTLYSAYTVSDQLTLLGLQDYNKNVRYVLMVHDEDKYGVVGG